VTDRWTGNPEGTRDYTGRAIHQPQDWARLPTLDPHQRVTWAQQLECLRLLTRIFDRNAVIQTIFSPMSQAKNLVGGMQLLVHLRRDPEALHAGLRHHADHLRFIEEAVKTGIDGVFMRSSTPVRAALPARV
jgi:uroporphyrinogen decarboxylase